MQLQKVPFALKGTTSQGYYQGRMTVSFSTSTRRRWDKCQNFAVFSL